MTRYFFIFALPRSRTAWLSNWLTTDRSMCFHEFGTTVREGTWNAVRAIIKPYMGLSEPSPEALNYIPAQVLKTSPLAVITQPVWLSHKRCLSACPAIYNSVERGERLKNLLEGWETVLEQVKAMPNCKSIPENALGDLDTLAGLWMHLVPDLVYNQYRTRMLLELSITVRYKTLEQAQLVMDQNKQFAWDLQHGRG